MQNHRSILVGIDFTPGSRVALAEAFRIASWNRASVRAVHVIDSLVAAELEEALSAFQQDVRGSLIADAQKAWTEFLASSDASWNALQLEVRIDNRIHGILEAARDAEADLLVLGAWGERAPHVGAGSIATACVRHALSDVLIVRSTQTSPFKTVVACVDFSPTSRAALDQAVRIAIQDGAALHVLHIFRAPWNELHYRSPTAEAAPHFQQQYREQLQRRLAAFAGELGREVEYAKPVFALVDHHGHRSGIVAYAEQIEADLIVLGTRGRTNWRDVLLGSTAEKALDESSCSVLAVKPGIINRPPATGGHEPPTR